MSNADAIIKSLNMHPEQWECNRYYLENKEANISLWIASGRMFLEQKNHDNAIYFGIVDRFKVWSAFKKWNDAYINIQLFNNEEI